MRPRCLSIHAAYACKHAGACCTASWPIPVEPASLLRLQARGLVSRSRSEIRPLDPPANGLTLALARAADGACVFFDKEDGRLCRIHRDGGADLLPSACRAFPRMALHDGRGLSITLSHYCPTAARLLLTAGDILVVDAPDSLALGGAVEGLDATAVLPPLLRPGMLTDMEGYARWEEEAIAVLNDRRVTATTAMAVIRAATQETCSWRPGGGTLAEGASRAFARARDILQRGASASQETARFTASFRWDAARSPRVGRFAEAPADRRSLGGGWSGPHSGDRGPSDAQQRGASAPRSGDRGPSDAQQRGASAPRWDGERRESCAGVPPLEHATKAFLAAHLFASWAAYQQGGLIAVVEAVEAAFTLVGTGHEDDEAFVSAVRAADLRLRHG